jgi:hypothetical protein
MGSFFIVITYLKSQSTFKFNILNYQYFICKTIENILKINMCKAILLRLIFVQNIFKVFNANENIFKVYKYWGYSFSYQNREPKT